MRHVCLFVCVFLLVTDASVVNQTVRICLRIRMDSEESQIYLNLKKKKTQVSPISFLYSVYIFVNINQQ